MKKISLFVLLFCFLNKFSFAQNYTSIATTGYNLDAVAENTTALANTGGAIDGSDYILYSAAYGALYSVVGGLPNSGVISSTGYSFQLQPYTQNNMLFLLVSQTNAISITTPSAYASVSLLGFATEGTGSMNVTLGFTDNSTQTFNNLSLDDWFGGSTSIISGFGRAGRTSGTIVNPAGQPKLFNTNLHLSCANRLKNLATITINNVSSNARICIMAVAGSDAPAYTASSTPVSCVGGTNGTAFLQIANALPPNTFTWNSTPVQNSGVANNLISGLYSFTVNDGAGCSFNSTVAVGVSTTLLPSLQVGTSSTLVCPGTPVTLSTFGAVTYTWSNGLNSPVTSVTPSTTTTYSVFGTTAANCLVSGGVTISTHTVQAVAFSPIPNSFCINSQSLMLSATPGGGTFTGNGLVGSAFLPSLAGVGSFTLSYTLSDANNCQSSQSHSTSVHALPQISFSVTPAEFCINAPSITLTANPSGGIYSGNGVSGSVFTPSLHAVGSSSITYVFTDGNNCTDSAKTSITVHALPVISFTPPPASMCIKAATISLQAGPTGGQFTGNGLVGSAFSPSLAGLGTHVLSYAFTNTLTTCSNSQSHSITVSACTGINQDQDASTGLLIFPNPSPSFIAINGKEEGHISLLNQLGQLVAEYSLDQSNAYSLSLEGLSQGLYSLCFTTQTGTKVYKILVSK